MKKHYYVFSSLFLSAAITLSACGSGGGSSALPVPPFSQADLAGSWYVSILQTGPTVSAGVDPGWIRGTAAIVSSGSVSAPGIYTSQSVTTPVPGPGNIVWTIDPWTGIISETNGTNRTDFHGRLAANKKILAGTATAGTNVIQLLIMQKLVKGASYSISDIAGRAFMMHQMASGTNTDWGYASGSTDGSAMVSLSTLTTSSGATVISGPVGTMSIDPGTGLVTMDTNTWFQGMMSSDKTYFVATETDRYVPGIFRLTVVQMAPSSPISTSDLAGSWHFHGLLDMPAWIYQKISIKSSGNLTITSELTSMGTSTNVPRSSTAQIDSAGNSTVNGDDTLHATLSSNKDMLVSTQTITTDSGSFNMFGVTIK